MKTKKHLTKIEFLDNVVVLEFNEQLSFQFCKHCQQQGEHLRTFVHFFLPELNIETVSKKSLRYLEWRLFQRVAEGKIYRILKRELQELMEEVVKRLPVGEVQA